MANISDVIEKFILSNMLDDMSIDVSRSELANHFSCAKSQINYVLSTRFTTERGYVVEGKRGGGGYIRIVRIHPGEEITAIINDELSDGITERQGVHILERLCDDELITPKEKELLKTAISSKSLSNPYGMSDKIRGEIIKNVLYKLS